MENLEPKELIRMYEHVESFIKYLESQNNK